MNTDHYQQSIRLVLVTILSSWVGLISAPASAVAADWVATTAELVEQEKPGYGKLCGVLVDHMTGDVIINLSDKGLYRSTAQAKTWKRLGAQPLKGRTEWPGCLMLDPTGQSKKLVAALVYGSPIAVSADEGATWKVMN